MTYFIVGSLLFIAVVIYLGIIANDPNNVIVIIDNPTDEEIQRLITWATEEKKNQRVGKQP